MGAFEHVGVAMFGYMTEINTVEMTDAYKIEASGHDMESLLFHFLDEWLFAFSAEPFFIPRKIVITDLDKHPQGTEVKAITYSAMQICYSEESRQHELYV